MTIEEIEARVKEIDRIKDDDEAAHGRENDLYMEFIEYVATLPDLPLDLAVKAQWCLKTQTIDFARWCA
jgi:hypothetical protein